MSDDFIKKHDEAVRKDEREKVAKGLERVIDLLERATMLLAGGIRDMSQDAALAEARELIAYYHGRYSPNREIDERAERWCRAHPAPKETP
jgi:hypothetical protein